ncbi:cell division protein FtsQ/DivIB [Evansella sp. AB-rgal1]|uniref:cell division protein FtsQ/DivIB n=1 Tax=Evansella sp. AB-rgal1 TaxID=3242696 RepID=UPI00359D01DF
MNNKNVIDIEERIPTLKDRRKQRANRRLIFYISFFFILITIVTYFQSSISHVKSVEVTGNIHVPTDLIVVKSRLLDETSMWGINEDAIKNDLLAHQEISNISIARAWPNTVTLLVEEYERIAYIQEDGLYTPLLENGEVLSSLEEAFIPYDAPLIVDFVNENQKMQMAQELLDTPQYIRERISEIYLAPSENDPLRIILYMNDGFVVHSTIRRFSERISPYPSIIEHLDPAIEGIVHMRMNPYFERFTSEEDEVVESEG